MKKPGLLALVLSLSFLPGLAAQTYTFATFPAANSAPGAIAVDSAGNIYTATYYGTLVVKTSPLGVATVLAGDAPSGSLDGTGSAARFYYVRGMVVDATGNVFVADTNNNTIRKVTAAGVVTTLAGSATASGGSTDGTGSAARFNGPQGIAIDATGNLYVADVNNHVIRKITPDRVVTTLAGLAGANGAVNATGSAARFNTPRGVAVDASNNLFVTDTGNHAIRKITAAGVVTTFAGSLANRGFADGPAAIARFDSPQGIAADSSGTLFVAESGNYLVRKLGADGTVTTLGGAVGFSGSVDGVGAAARFSVPVGIAVSATGNLYVAESYSVRAGVPSGQLAITVQPLTQSVAAGSATTLSVTATGAEPIGYQWQKNGTAIPGATSSTLAFPSVQALDGATYTVTASNSVGTAVSSGAALTVLAPIANDNFANAQVITGNSGSVTGTNNGATGEPTEPTHFVASATASSVWYRWTPTQGGTAVLSSSGASGLSVSNSIYTGTSLAALTRITQGASSQASFPVTSGTTYYIAVGSSGTSRGNFTLSWRTLVNDNFANATVISGNSNSIAGDNTGATGEAGEPVHWPSSSAASTSVWYAWTPAETGTAVFIANGFVVAAYTGSSVSSLTPVPFPYFSYSNPTRAIFAVTAGVTYHIVVGSYYYSAGSFNLAWSNITGPLIADSSGGGSFSLGATVTYRVAAVSSFPIAYQWTHNGATVAGATSPTLTLTNVQATDTGSYGVTVSAGGGGVTLTLFPLTVLVPPANDNFASAQTIAGLTGSATGSNQNATGETGEPTHWNLSGTTSSVWYKWIAPASGLAVIDTVGSNFDTVMAIYTGSTFANLARLTQDDDRGGGRTSQVSFGATSGTTYYIAIGGSSSGTRGNITLNWQLSPVLAITTQPASQTIAVGSSATFSVASTGAGTTYQWSRNGVAIPGATGSTLTVGNIQAGGDASYTVTVTNSSGSVTSAPAALAVAAPALTTLTIRNSRTNTDLLWSIAAGGGNLVTVGGGGTILSSSDGRTWTPRNSGTTNWLVGVTYGLGQFVAVGDGGLILTSADGTTWTPVASSSTMFRLNNVIYADGKFVAVGEGGTIVTSSDAQTWTPRTSGTTNWLHGLAYNSAIGHFAASGQGGVFLYSPDGASWSALPIAGLTDDLEATVAVDSYAQFVAIGSNGMSASIRQNQLVLKTGETLVTWSGATTPTSTAVRLRGLVQGASALFATGEGGKVITATSDQGPWLTLPSNTTVNLLAGVFYNNTLFLVGENQTVLQSDGLYNSRLVNISTRGQVGTGANVMISGFVVTGTTPKRVLIRAAGPVLGTLFGLPGALAVPVLTLYNGANQPIAVNSGWGNATNFGLISSTTPAVGAFPFVLGTADSAILTTLAPGSYTAQIAGLNDTSGLSLIEVYDVDPLSVESSRAINISTRGVAGTGANQLIAGFVINGASSRRVLIRAVGPGLAAAPFGLPGTLAEPQLQLYNGHNALQTTAGAWGLQANADEIRGAAKAAGAFALADGSKDSAMVVTLLPGSWTVQVSGANNTSGLVIVEVYALP